jgi:hypothetical protein
MLAMALVISVLAGAGAGYVSATYGSPADPPTPAYTPVHREMWVFTVVLPFNDSLPGMPSHDYFAPDTIGVCKGDTLQIHFFNTEEEPEDHTFTMEAPYAMNHVLPADTTTDFNFTATAAGSFAYRCVYHQPTMTGWLSVRNC